MLLTWSLSRVPFSNKTGLPYVQRFGSNLAITLYLPFSFSSGSDSSLFESFFFAVCFCSESSCVATSFCWLCYFFLFGSFYNLFCFCTFLLYCSFFFYLFLILYCLLLLLQYFHYSVRFLQRFFLCCFFFHCYLPNYIFHFVLIYNFTNSILTYF